MLSFTAAFLHPNTGDCNIGDEQNGSGVGNICKTPN